MTYKTKPRFGTHEYNYGVMCKDTPFCCTMTGYKTEEEAINSWNTRKPVERILERLEDAKKNICGSYNYETPLLENPSHKIAFNNGIEKAIEIIKEGLE